MAEKTVTVRNRAGIHARPAALIAQTANKFSSEITIERDSTVINAKSIMGVITMAAGYNTELLVKAVGADEEAAVEAIYTLFENKFEDETEKVDEALSALWELFELSNELNEKVFYNH